MVLRTRKRRGPLSLVTAGIVRPPPKRGDVDRAASQISAFVVAAIFFLPPGFASAQSSAPPWQIGSVTVQGSVRTRLEGWDWFKAPGAENAYAFPGTLLRLSFSQQRRDFDWTFEVAAPVLLALPNDAIAPAPQGQLGFGGSYFAANHNSQNAALVFPKQVFSRF